MSSVYSPTAVKLDDITLPDDGDTIEAADVGVPLEAVADGVEFLNQRTDVLADLAALAAITTPADGLVRHVLGFGLYVFKTSATTGLSPFRVAAGDATAGGWKSSTAHETTRTVYAPGRCINGITGAAQAPTISSLFFNGPLAADGAYTAGSFSPSRASTDATNAWGFCLPIDEWLVEGATISSVTLRWTPDFAGAPAVYPQFEVVRTARTGLGATTTSLRSGGFVIDSGGTYDPTVTRNVLYTADQNNVIDLATYNYAVVIFDEHGAGATNGNTFHSAAVAMTAIPDARR